LPLARKGTRKGTLRVVANIQGRGIVYVMFYVDGHIRKLTNTPPFEWMWDTRTTPNGTHSLEIRGADANGRILTSQTQQVVVVN
jgi:Bacterial Ig domain